MQFGFSEFNATKNRRKWQHVLNRAKLEATITTAMRMLDKVVDINFYPVGNARNPILAIACGYGHYGFSDCLHALRIPYASMAAVELADRAMEAVCYHAYFASTG